MSGAPASIMPLWLRPTRDGTVYGGSPIPVEWTSPESAVRTNYRPSNRTVHCPAKATVSADAILVP